MSGDAPDTDCLLRQAADGDQEAVGLLLRRHEDRLRRLVSFRLDARLRGRIDPSDVVQEVHLAATRSLGDYLRRPDVPFFLWLRSVAGNKLLELHRHHLGAAMRDARREVPLNRGALHETTSTSLAACLLGGEAEPCEVAARAEARQQLLQALDGMDRLDREVLALRHFEHLSNAEAAQVLGIQERAAGKRYLRALERLRVIMAGLPGVGDE